MKVKLFDSTGPAQDILDEVRLSGVAGIYGGRVAVRGLASRVADLAAEPSGDDDEESQEKGSIWSGQTYNHPQTELAYVYDDNRFSPNKALQAVIAAYEVLNPPSEWL